MHIKKIKYLDWIKRKNNTYERKAIVKVLLNKDRKWIKQKIDVEIGIHFTFQDGGYIYSFYTKENGLEYKDFQDLYNIIEKAMLEDMEKMHEDIVKKDEAYEKPNVEIIGVRGHADVFGLYEISYKLDDKVERTMRMEIEPTGEITYQTDYFPQTDIEQVTKRFDWEKIVLDEALKHKNFRLRKVIHNIN